jgi:hypothetical protein
VDPVSLVIGALAAGALAGAGQIGSAAVKDAYEGLKQLVAARLRGRSKYRLVLEEHAKAPETWRAPLEQALTESGAATDEAVVRAAERLMELLDQDGARAGRYSVDLRRAQGVQVGDRNEQLNVFTAPPDSR